MHADCSFTKKRDFGALVFLWIWRNLLRQSFCRTPRFDNPTSTIICLCTNTFLDNPRAIKNNWSVISRNMSIVRSSHTRYSVKKVFLEISQNSQESTFSRVSFLIKLQAIGYRPATLLKKKPRHRRFLVNFVEFLITPFLTEHLWWLLLYCIIYFLTSFRYV